ncbi:Pyrroline-5-carboxylate reductase [Rhodopirellula islandica]|uniref:Pyrroline-5-carboxylate reductase n=1 Tax=Rhodopirellula islandica TaxID=595434 RepID=A0A0J1BAE4_RHOIS|nr:pyrroline-5-carboxylate reductase [Rhodopirellula islandica]KLU03690.1 Pyrroline-5-carboxylate reductase [Rhodopirellula islandica]
MQLTGLTVIGGGQMARALVGGMLESGCLKASELTVVHQTKATGDWWGAKYPGCTTSTDTVEAVSGASTVMLAVKPHIIAEVLAVKNADGKSADWSGRLIVSIAAGIGLDKLTQGVGHDRVVRVMPNTPSLVGEGASGYCVSLGVSDDDVKLIETMLNSVGIASLVTEPQMNAVTGVSGSGPAYVFLIIEALADGGVAAGLPRATALKLATQTVLGAAKMVRETGEHPGVLKDNVCSPGGTTIAAMSVLEQNAVRGAMIQAVQASANRSRELA